MVTKEDVHAWYSDPVTVLHLKRVREYMSRIEEIVLKGNLVNMPDVGRQYAYHLGMIRGLDEILDSNIIDEVPNDSEEVS